jgi:CheY-like chemotaxis protein
MVNPLRILVVEDNPVNQKLLGLMLQQFGYTSAIAANGKIGFELYEKGPFDLILMDIQMPVMDGFEATAAIRERERESGGHIPIIAVTAHVMPGYREKCLAAGMDNYIPKPFKMQELKDIIAETLQQTNIAP